MTSNGPVQGGVLGDFQEKERLPPWPDGVLYHGARLLIMVGLAASITALFPPVGRSTVGRYEAGMVLIEPVIAQVPFTVPKSVAELQRERADAAAGVPPTFDYRLEAADTMAIRLGRFFDQLPAFIRTSVDDFRHLALLDDRVSLGSNSCVAEEVVDILETNRGLVDQVLRFARSVESPTDLDLTELGIIGRRPTILVGEGEDHLRHTDGRPIFGAGKDDIIHTIAAKPTGGLLAHHPANGIDHITLAAAVRTNDGCNAVLETKSGGINKGFEAMDLQ